MALRGAYVRYWTMASARRRTPRAITCSTLNAPALLSVFGGKITTFRRLAEAAMAKLARFFPGMRGDWTAAAALPGGDFAGTPWGRCGMICDGAIHFYPTRRHGRLVHAYGTLALEMLGDARSNTDLGRCFGADLTAREVAWLMRTEWALTAEDVLWRRSKLGMRMDAGDAARLGECISTRTTE